MFDTTTNGKRFSLTMVLALALVVAAAHFANPLAAQSSPGTTLCFECVPGCEQAGGGYLCGLASGRLGGIDCEVNSGPIPGSNICHCWLSGGVCEVAPDNEDTLLAEREAIDAVIKGEGLAADGLFYIATRGNELIVRRKCGGKAIGRIVVAEHGDRMVEAVVG